jgi:hypothetical protein
MINIHTMRLTFVDVQMRRKTTLPLNERAYPTHLVIGQVHTLRIQ